MGEDTQGCYTPAVGAGGAGSIEMNICESKEEHWDYSEVRFFPYRHHLLPALPIIVRDIPVDPHSPTSCNYAPQTDVW